MSEFNVNECKLLLAKAVRMLENIELLDMNGHISYRIPGTDQILINSRKASRASLTVNDIVMADLEGRLLEGSSEPPSEVHIHTWIYKLRPDVFSVVHNHPHFQTVLGIAGLDLKPVFSIGAFVQDIPVYEKSSLINIPQMGEELARALGGARAIQLRHHGSVVVGEDVKDVFTASVLMEENAKKQYYASLLGPSMRIMEGENLQRTRDTNWSPSIKEKIWHYHEEKASRDGALDRIG